MAEPTTSRSMPARWQRSLIGGVLVFRWVWLAWMTFLAATAVERFTRPWLAWTALGAAAAWTAWLTVARDRHGEPTLIVDVVVCAALVLGSGLVVSEGAIVAGRPFFATGYPLSAPLLWGAVGGPWRGLAAGVLLALAHAASRPLNGVSLADLGRSDVQNLAGAAMNYIVAGVAVGLVARFLARSEAAVQRATAELIVERERSARLGEREKIARRIHDSVLQTLALVHKRAAELSGRGPVPPEAVAQLASMTQRQEQELRALITRETPDPPGGARSLRDALEATARLVPHSHATVSSVGPIFLDGHRVDEAAAAVRQALENVAQHARASKTTVFAEDQDGRITITVKDDGTGFSYDAERLRADNKAGILKSMKGRVEELDGAMTITTAPGRGTEVEFAFPRTQR